MRKPERRLNRFEPNDDGTDDDDEEDDDHDDDKCFNEKGDRRLCFYNH